MEIGLFYQFWMWCSKGIARNRIKLDGEVYKLLVGSMNIHTHHQENEGFIYHGHSMNYTIILNVGSALNQHSFLLNESKHYLMSTFNAIHVH